MTSFNTPSSSLSPSVRWNTRRVLRLAAIPVIAAAGIALVACSADGDATPTAEGSPTPTATATSSPTATSTATGAPTETGTASATPTQIEEPTVEDAVDALQAYFNAIDAGDYATAYATWSNAGEASDQTFEEFRDGFADTQSVLAEIGEPGRVDAAAGSRYVEIPVTIISTLTDGTVERFQGTYVFRRAVVDGATPEQRSWRIYSADIEQVAP